LTAHVIACQLGRARQPRSDGLVHRRAFRLAFDPRRSQFYCPGTNPRWNRIGHPIGARASSGPYWDLTLHVAAVAQDGHVLVRPFYR
jgi:hypothetical protein